MTINLRQAAQHYKNLPGQNAAWDYLQLTLDENELAEFAKLYRNNPEASPKAEPSGDPIIRRIRRLGFKLELGKAYVVGIEGVGVNLKPNTDELDMWNDVVLLLIINKDKTITKVGPFKATTEPGRYYTTNPMNPRGGARVLIDSFNKEVWMRGTHIKQTNCLIQIGAPITVTRDGNKDGKRGQTEFVESGWFGINLHHTNTDNPGPTIGRWSAGCTVVAKKSEHQLIMSKLPKEQSKFSYILLDGSKL